MTNIIKALTIFSMLLVLGSCEKEVQTFQPTEPSTQMTASISGAVIDEQGEPVVGATVTYRGAVGMTNESGLYQFENTTVDSKHNTLRITKNGFFEGARTFRSTVSSRLFQKTVLVEKQFEQSFSSSAGGTVSDVSSAADANVQIVFAAGTIVHDGTQDPYDGEVEVAMHYIDPTSEAADEVMPGDLSVLLADDVLGKASTYGMAYVDLQSPSGQPLQIKDGATAQLSITVPEELRSVAPSEVKTSYFDESLGLWKEEGSATLQGDSYVSEVTHFSCWSYNSSSPSIVLSARVVDEFGQPVPGVHVQVTEQDRWQGGYGKTDQDGVFSGAVAKDAVLNIFLSNLGNCPGQNSSLLRDQVGPFAADTNLGDIIVDASAIETVTVQASFTNCDGDPVTNGVAYVARQYFNITDGTLSVTVPACEDLTNVLWAHDLDTDRVSARLTLTVGELNDVGEIQLCETEAPYLHVMAPSLGIDEVTMVETGASGLSEQKRIISLFGFEIAEDWHNMELLFTDPASPTGFSVGTFVLDSGTIEIGTFPAVLTYEAGNGEGEIVISEVSTDELGDYIRGSFRIDFTEVANGTVHEFRGTFKLNFW